MKNDLKTFKKLWYESHQHIRGTFVLRKTKTAQDEKFRLRPDHGKWFALRIAVKKEIHKNDWNFGKGTAKPKNEDLRKSTAIYRNCKESWSGISENCNWKMNPLPLHLSKMPLSVLQGKITRTLLWLVINIIL